MAQSTLRPERESHLATIEKAVKAYSSTLWLANDYLRARGISESTADGFRLGLVQEPEPGHEAYEGMLAIPYLIANQVPVTVRFRCIAEHGKGLKCKDLGHGKYRTMPHDPARMFNVKAIHEALAENAQEIHIAEGEMDAVILEQLDLFAVALPGANQWRPHHSKMLAGFERIYVWGDPDGAGQGFASEVVQSMRQAQRVPLSRGDVNETYLSGGSEAIYEAMEKLTWG